MLLPPTSEMLERRRVAPELTIEAPRNELPALVKLSVPAPATVTVFAAVPLRTPLMVKTRLGDLVL